MGDQVCLRNFPIYHSGAIAVNISGGLPKIGHLLQSVWKGDSKGLFKVVSSIDEAHRRNESKCLHKSYFHENILKTYYSLLLNISILIIFTMITSQPLLNAFYLEKTFLSNFNASKYQLYINEHLIVSNVSSASCCLDSDMKVDCEEQTPALDSTSNLR